MTEKPEEHLTRSLLEHVLDAIVKKIGKDEFLRLYSQGFHGYVSQEGATLPFQEEIVSYEHRLKKKIEDAGGIPGELSS